MTQLESTESQQPDKRDFLPGILIYLFKGVIYRESDEKLWSELIKLQTRVRDFVRTIGLELTLDEGEGYAFLRSTEITDDDEDAKQPKLMIRRQLSFPLSLLIALLRKRLVEFDARGGETRLVLSREEIIDLIKVFLPEGSNETKIVRQVDAQINKVIELGFLKELKTDSTSKEKSFEVRRIMKAFVDAQWLSTFDEKLAQYQEKSKTLSGLDDND
ncbi:hypothetical protein BH10CYA1_BH10CYA1_56330 [soil metagenome]